MKFFRFLFAEDGDKTAVPDTIQPSGQVSYEEGYGPEYELLQSDPDKRNIERRQHNQLLHDLTLNSRQYHTDGFPEFITAAENGGVAYEYNQAACVRYNGHSGFGIYYSLVSANNTTPTDATKWALFNPNPSLWRTGDIKHTERTDLESGWVWRNGTTIGNAASGAVRANADTYDLFVLYWNTRPNSILPILNSNGTAGTRGLTADADWAANKRMPVSDQRGRFSAGHDAMGGVAAAGRLTDGVTGGVVGNQIGAFGGFQTHTLIPAEIPAHDHTPPGYSGLGSLSFFPNSTPPTFGDGRYLHGTNLNFFARAQMVGNDQPHNNVPPVIIDNYMVKL